MQFQYYQRESDVWRLIMKALIIYMSVSHGNTRKIAERIAQVLNADLVEAKDIDDPIFLSKYPMLFCNKKKHQFA